MARLVLSRRKAWGAVIAAGACALLLALLVTSSALEAGKGLWAAFFLLLLGSVAAVVVLFAEETLWNVRHWTGWLQPRPISLLFVAIFAAFGTMTDALALFEPRPAVESAPGAIEHGVEQVRGDVRQILNQAAPARPAAARIVEKIGGLWGEPGCQVTYRFALRGDALVVTGERRPFRARPYRLVATIIGRQGDILDAVGEEPAEARGKAATFTYHSNGLTERLIWHDRVSPVPLELDRCG